MNARSHRLLPLAAVAVLVATVPSRATTLMALVDWIDTAKVDTVLRTDSVWIQAYDGTNGSYYDGTTNLQLARTDAFAASIPVNPGFAASVQVPRTLHRDWYALPNFNSNSFVGQGLRIQFNFLGGKHVLDTSNPAATVLRLDTSAQVGLTGALTGGSWDFLNQCIDTLKPVDTVWIRDRRAVSPNPSLFDCVRHNPFWSERGLVWFHPPEPVTHPIVEQDGLRIPMRFDPRFPGWAYGALLDSSAQPSTTRRLRFLALDSKLDTLRWDSAGKPWTVKIDSGDSVWRMPEGPSPNQHPDPLRPTIWFGFPTDTRLALGAGLDGFTGKPVAVGWSGLPLWVRPDTVWLIHSTGAVSRGIHVPSTGDSVWLAADTVSAGRQASPLDTAWLKARAFDYDHSYKPFAESGPDDACQKSGGGPTKGLVRTSLDSAGLPVWTGMVACDIGTPADGPGNWFKPGHALLDTAISIPLALSKGLGIWSYNNPAFFPLDHASTAGKGGNNFGFCLHFQFEASNFSDAEVSIMGDDDIWLFAQDRLVVDLGGQHSAMAGKFAFGAIGEPDGGVIRMDLFQCERHAPGSTLAISSNALLLPIGTLAEASQTTKNVNNVLRKPSFGLAGRRLVLDPSGMEEWSVEVRRLDGRVVADRSGRGAASLDLPGRGPVAVEWRSSGIREKRVFVLP